jgi:hypothetical protein
VVKIRLREQREKELFIAQEPTELTEKKPFKQPVAG